MSKWHEDGSLAILTVYFWNPFNMVVWSVLLHEVKVKCLSISLWVNFVYGQTTMFYLWVVHIMSFTGVQQGGLLGTLMFSIVLHPFIHNIKDKCKFLLHVQYHDDETIIRGSKKVAKFIEIIQENWSFNWIFVTQRSFDLRWW